MHFINVTDFLVILMKYITIMQKTFVTRASHLVPHGSTRRALCDLTSWFEWIMVLSTWYERMCNDEIYQNPGRMLSTKAIDALAGDLQLRML